MVEKKSHSVGNTRRTKQSKQPNVNSSEAMSTQNSNKNAKKQANHSAEIKTEKQQRCQQEKN